MQPYYRRFKTIILTILIISVLIGILTAKGNDDIEEKDKADFDKLQEVLDILDEDKEYKEMEKRINTRSDKKSEESKEWIDKLQQDFYEAEKLFIAGKRKLQIGEYLAGRTNFKKALDIIPTNGSYKYYYDLTFFPEIVLSTDSKIIFTNNIDSINLNIQYLPRQSFDNWVSNWELKLTDEQGGLLRKFSGKGIPPLLLKWDMRDLRTNVVPLGTYNLGMECKGDYFCKFNTASYSFVLQEARTIVVNIEAKPRRFYVSNDTVELTITASDRANIDTWQLDVRYKDGEIVRTWDQGTLPEALNWDTKDNNGRYADDGRVFTVSARGRTKTGIDWESNDETIESLIKIVEEEEVVKFDLYTIEFDFARAYLRSESKRIIDRAAAIYKRFPGHDILIIGHTDHVDTEEYNVILSKRRSWAVMNYLNKEYKIPLENMSAFGMGESKPKRPNTSSENRQRNRRVEFIIRDKSERSADNFENNVTFGEYNLNNYNLVKADWYKLDDQDEVVIKTEREMKQVQATYQQKYQRIKKRMTNENYRFYARKNIRRIAADLLYENRAEAVNEMIAEPQIDVEYYFKGIANFHLMKDSTKARKDRKAHLAEVLTLLKTAIEKSKDRELIARAWLWYGRTLDLKHYRKKDKIHALKAYDQIIKTDLKRTTILNDAIYFSYKLHKSVKDKEKAAGLLKRLKDEVFIDKLVYDYDLIEIITVPDAIKREAR